MPEDATYLSLMMVAGDGRGAELSRCLDSVLRRTDGESMVDELVLVETGSGEAERAARDVCFAHGVPVWVGYYRDGLERPAGSTFSFAEARNVALDAAQGKWAIWLDSDDVVPGGAEAQRAETARRDARAAKKIDGSNLSLKDILRRLPDEILAVRSPYHYEHGPDGRVTTCIPRGDRVVRLELSDGTRPRWRWSNVVHENLFLDPEEHDGWVVKSTLPRVLPLDGLIVVHMPSDEGHAERSRDRNRRLLLSELARMGDDAHPQVLHHVAEHLRRDGDAGRADAILDQIIRDCPWAPGNAFIAGFLARMSKASALVEAGRYDEALAVSSEATAFAPAFSDAYYASAVAFFGRGDLARAVALAAQMSGKESLSDRLGVDSDRVARLCQLAEIHREAGELTLALEFARQAEAAEPGGRGSDELKRAEKLVAAERARDGVRALALAAEPGEFAAVLERLPRFLQSDPSFDSLAAEVGASVGHWHDRPAGRGTIAIIAPGAPLPWGAHTGEESGIGGSEEAVVHVARRLASRGWRVDVYTNLERDEEIRDGVAWLSRDRLGEGGVQVRADVGVYWRCPNLELPRASFGAKLAWLHDTTYPATKQQWAQFDRILGVSEYHAGLLRAQARHVAGRVGHVQNGIDPAQFRTGAEKVRGRFVWTSSPDRGLDTLLAMWPKVRAAMPHATLRVLYGWDVAEKLRALGSYWAAQPAEKARIAALADQPGVEWVGRVPWQRAADEMLAAEVWAYPTRFTEVSCISAQKALAAGCSVICSDVGALTETVPPEHRATVDFSTGTREEQDARFLAKVLEVAPLRADFSDQRRWALETYDWDRAVDAWEAIFDEMLGRTAGEKEPACPPRRTVATAT